MDQAQPITKEELQDIEAIATIKLVNGLTSRVLNSSIVCERMAGS